MKNLILVDSSYASVGPVKDVVVTDETRFRTPTQSVSRPATGTMPHRLLSCSEKLDISYLVKMQLPERSLN